MNIIPYPRPPIYLSAPEPQNGNTALILAVERGNDKVVGQLIAANANVDLQTKVGNGFDAMCL